MPRGFYPNAMRNFTPWIAPVPAPSVSTHDEEPARCIRISEALIPYLLGMLELARYEHTFSGSEEDKMRAMIVFQDLATAFALEDVCEECEDCDMYLLRQNADNPCQLEQSTDGGVNWSLAFDFRRCLFDEQINPPLTRYNEDSTHEEQSIDGGTTWVEIPDGRDKSPLTTDIYADRDDPVCWHANNATLFVKFLIEDSGDDIIAIISAFTAYLLSVLASPPAAWIINAVVTGVLEAGLASARSQMDDLHYEELTEILYCNSDVSWGWTPLGWAAALNEINDKFPLAASLFTQGIIQLMGSIGLSNAGHMHFTENADCSDIDCGEWWYQFDFVLDNYESVGFTHDLGIYNGLTGYECSADACQNAAKCMQFGVDKHLEFPTTQLLGYIVELAPQGSGNFYWSVFRGSGGAIDNHNGQLAGLYDRANIWENDPADAAWGMLWGMGDFNPVSCGRLVLHGLGTNPFGADNYIYDPNNP